MNGAVMERLADYLGYMRDMGFGGLALEENPFVTEAPAPVTARTGSPARHAARPSAAPAPARPRAVPSPPPAAQLDIPNVASILDMATPGSPIDENERKAAAVTGDSSEDLLRNLYQAFHNCEACALGTTRTKFVFGEGPPRAELMFVGEGPGRDEDLSGRPFVGPAGQLLDKIIMAMGYQRGQVFIANVVKCRPPENRVPLPDEMAACAPLLKRQIEAVGPRVIVVLGSTALRYFVGAAASIMRMRGKFFQWEGRDIMPTFHPAYILRNPRAKREVWDDMKSVLAHLKKSGKAQESRDQS